MVQDQFRGTYGVVLSHSVAWVMLYAPPYGRRWKYRFGTDRDGFPLRDSWRARGARLRPLFPRSSPGQYAGLDPRCDSPVQDAAGAGSIPVSGRASGPKGASDAPRSGGAVPVLAVARRCACGDGGRGRGRDHALPDDGVAGDAARGDSPRLRRRGRAQDRLLRERGAHRDPTGTRGPRGLSRKGQGPPAASAGLAGRGDAATSNSEGARPVDGELRSARRPPRNVGRAGRRAPRPAGLGEGREARKGAPQGMRSGNGGQVAAALLVDALFGEPPEAVHPTVLMGHSISAFERTSLQLENPGSRRLAGIALALLLPTLVFVSTRKVLDAAPGRLRWTIGTALISTTLSMRGLAKAAGSVEHALRERRLEEARTRVEHFVGRDTEDLSEPVVCRAAVESVAENTSDGIVAPMLYGLLFGAPGALAYKAVNTMDSMIGYRQPPYTDFGWAAARLDDPTNLAPSRLTMLSVAAISGRPLRSLLGALRYSPLTTSPNAGMAEAAFAGALGIRLGGANTYGGMLREGPVLGDGRLPAPEDIGGAVLLMRRCCVLVGILALLAERLDRG